MSPWTGPRVTRLYGKPSKTLTCGKKNCLLLQKNLNLKIMNLYNYYNRTPTLYQHHKPPCYTQKCQERKGAQDDFFWWEIYTLICCRVRLQNEKWMPNACGYWESISFLSIKLWVALIEFSQNPKPRDPWAPEHKMDQKRIYDNLEWAPELGVSKQLLPLFCRLFPGNILIKLAAWIISMTFCSVQSVCAKSSSAWLK